MDVYFTKTGQFIKLISVVGLNETYWQIIIDNSDKIIIIYNILNNIYLNNYESIVYDDSSLNLINTNLFISFIDIKQNIENDIFIILPQMSTHGIKKFIICFSTK